MSEKVWFNPKAWVFILVFALIFAIPLGSAFSRNAVIIVSGEGGGDSSCCYWSRDGTTLYTNVSTDDVVVNQTVTVGDTLSVNQIIQGVHAGGIDVSGDPWYLSGVDWQIAQDLILDGYVLSDLLPNPTLTYDLGSGSNRWNWLYVADANVERLNASETIEGLGDWWCGGDLDVEGNVYSNGVLLTGGGGDSYWDRDGTTLYTATDDDDIQINGTSMFENNMTVEDTVTLTNTTASISWDIYVDTDGVLVWRKQ